MADGQEGDFVSYMRRRAGDALRLVGVYDHERFKVRYLRADLERKFGDGDLAAVETELRKESLERAHEEDVFALGGLDATVRIFENAVVVHYPRDRTSGTARLARPRGRDEPLDVRRRVPAEPLPAGTVARRSPSLAAVRHRSPLLPIDPTYTRLPRPASVPREPCYRTARYDGSPTAFPGFPGSSRSAGSAPR